MEASRREGILRLTRRCAAEPSGERVLRTLLEGAVDLLDADDGGIAAWDASEGVLRQVQSFLPSESLGAVLDLAGSASGRAVTTRAPVLIDDYQREIGATTPAGRLGAGSGMAVPLQQEGRLIGTISLSRMTSRPFTADDAFALELLAGIAASVMVGEEDRQRADAAVRATEERFQQIAETAPDLIWVLDDQARIRYVNQQIARLGYTADEVVGQSPEMLTPPDHHAIALERHHRAMATGEADRRPQRYELDLLARDGTRVPYELSASSLRDADGRPMGRVGIFRELTERRRAEAALRTSEERFRQIAEAASDVIWVVNDRGRITYANPQVARLGYTPEELHGLPSGELNTPESRKIVAAVFRSGMAGEQDRARYEADFVAKDGTVMPFEVASASLRDEAGRPIGRVVVLRDITERRRAEEALRASEERFRRIAEAADDIIWVLDADARITYANPKVERLGYTQEELVGRRSRELMPAPSRDVAAEIFQRSMAGEVDRARYEVELTARDGTVAPFEITSGSVRDDTGRPVGRVVVLRDVSDRRMLEAELRRARDLAMEMSEAKSAFLANMSHEIRTPLNGVIGMTGLLLDTALDAEQRDYAEVVRGSAEALLSVINDILDFSKIEADKLDLDATAFDPGEWLESAVELVAAAASQRGLELAVSVEPDVPPAVVGDPTRLRQVLLNLLGNAVKFTEQGEVVASLALDGLAAGRARLHFRVRDTGIGIPRERLARIFDAFTQADSSTARRFGGTGLGLAISQRLVELMGGRMWVESEIGQGSTFHFTLVVDVAEAAERPAPPGADRAAGRSLLVVDDNATNRQILVRQTEAWGMRPRATGHPAEALEWIAAGEPFELAILDQVMPDMDGLVLTAEIRRHRGPAELPIVLSTSLGHRPDAEEVERLGIAAALVKPIRSSQLFETVVRVLSGERLAPAPRAGSAAQPDDPKLAERVPLRILVAEDSPVNQRVTLGQLKRLGYSADLAANGLEVLDALERRRYDLVFMDVQMPEMDGLEATRRVVARWPTGQRPRIVAMTAHALPGDREICLRAGMDDYLSKPIRLPELVAALERAGGAAESAPAAPIFGGQLAQMREEVGDEVFAEMLADFARDTPVQLDAIDGAIAAGDAATVRRLAHTLKGNASYLGASELMTACAELEALARDDRLDAAPARTAGARAAYERLRPVLDEGARRA